MFYTHYIFVFVSIFTGNFKAFSYFKEFSSCILEIISAILASSDKSKAKNIDLWERLLKLIEYHNVKFMKVKGHADNEYNNRCDKLAVKAREAISK